MLHRILLVAAVVNADNPFDWSPSVSLTANLEEPQDLGFCIDIAGFGANLNCAGSLQAHSCKEAGSDTQFEYFEKSLRAVNYNAACGTTATSGEDRACVQVSGDIAEGATLTLSECNDSPEQTFELVNKELRIGTDGSMCLVASTTLRQAGRFVARDLFLSSCATTSSEFKEWTITPTPGGSGFCFPGNAKVYHREKGWTSMKEVIIGDHVLVDDKGTYEPIYSFGHYDTNAKTEFLQIETDQGENLGISGRHMLFVHDEGRKSAVPASDLKVGMMLLTANGSASRISNTKPVSQVGVFAPFTPSGTVVIDDFVASAYVAVSTSTSFPNQWIAHSFMLPHRVWCFYLGQCINEFYTDEGISTWVAGPHNFSLWLFAQSEATIGAFLVALVPVLIVYTVTEWVLINHSWCGLLLVAAYATMRIAASHKKKRV